MIYEYKTTAQLERYTDALDIFDALGGLTHGSFESDLIRVVKDDIVFSKRDWKQSQDKHEYVLSSLISTKN